jgi:hypothetical protein
MVMVATDNDAAICASNLSAWCIPDSHRLELLVLLGKHELGDLDWRGHHAVVLRHDRHEINFANKIVKQPESVGRKLGK